MAKILVIDDEQNIRASLKSALDRRGHETVTAESYAEGARFASGDFDIIFLDVMLGDGNGLDLLRAIRHKQPQQTVVMISGQADIDMAVDAIRSGAYDFIEKPLSLDRVLVTIDNAVATRRLRAETERLSSLVYGEFIGESAAVRQLREKVAIVAGKASRFLITGENGTGKELVANMLHRSGSHRDGAFVAVNCAAVPMDLFESELFGHVKGAFTGATSDRKGRFVEADRGSLFLDEITEMPAEAQAKLLRALETRTITPVGSDREITVDCNLIAASNRDIEQTIADGNFREDLYYRLNVILIELPPLRERPDDIPLLAAHFLARFAGETGSGAKQLERGAIDLLKKYHFPGNVRELKNLMERVNIYCERETIRAADLRPLMPPRRESKTRKLKDAVLDFEREYIERAIARNDGNMTETARQLGIERSHLYKKIAKYEKS